MAFSGFTQRGTAVEKVSDTTHTLTPTGTLAVGKLGIITVGIDNITTTDGDTTDITISDTGSNTWTRVKERNESTGVAGDGITVAIFYSVLTAQLTTGSTVTLTTSAATICKAFDLNEFTISSSSVQVAAGTNPATTQAGGWTANDPTAVTVSGLTSKEYLLIATFSQENELTTVTDDADYTLLSTNNTGTAGTGLSNLVRYSSHRIATLTTDTYDAVMATPPGVDQSATGWVAILAAIEEVSAAAVNSAWIVGGRDMIQAIYPTATG